jgi:uncharacterized protein YecE (DUF72 family)
MILISTSGFSYDDWIGRFYPHDINKNQLLPYFAQYFSSVELNYSYYTFPGKKGIEGHLRNAPGMKFALKAHSRFTHQRDYGKEELICYQAALDQLRHGDALICLLLQFPYSFHATDENRKYVDRLVSDFKDFPLAVEFRHAKWKNHVTYNQFQQNNCALVTTDAPDLPNLYRGGWESVGPFGYVRLHGRNSEKWWEHEHGWQRYDYLYSKEQIAGMAAAVSKLTEPDSPEDEEKKERDLRDVYVFFNNHWQSQGAINALQLSLELGLKTPEELPDFIGKILSR